MSFRPGSQLHYHCNFTVAPRHPTRTAWSELVKVVRSWINFVTESDEGLFGAWFFTGGAWLAPPAQRMHVETAQEVGNVGAHSPEFWALRYEHACKEVQFRQWRTDVGVSTHPRGFQLSVTTSHWLLPGYIGKEPDAPLPTAPGVVSSLLRSKAWTCEAGSEPLSAWPRIIRSGEGELVIKRLAAVDRSCPIVLVSRTAVENIPALAVDALAKHLGGTAVVYVAESNALGPEWDACLPTSFRCHTGMARIYQPGVRFDNPKDARRHRYFTAEQIEELTDEEVRKMIIRGIARRTNVSGHEVLTNIEEIQVKRRNARLQALRRAADDIPGKDELIQLLDQNNQELETEKKRLEMDHGSLQDKIDDLELQVDERDTEIARQNRQIQLLGPTVGALERELALMEGKLSTFEKMSSLPSSVGEVVELISKLYPAKLVFTKEARDSTKDRQDSLAPVAWEHLWAMATALHSLVFSERTKRADFQGRFKNLTGLDLSLTEGKMTKNDNKLMALRRQLYEGKPIDITPHLKYGVDDPKLLRIHFFIDETKSRFVVGHCGGHLDTYGTRRR